MYSQEAIDILIQRIGWSELGSDLPISLSVENKISLSGKSFNFYHPLVTIDNIYSFISEVDMTETDFNLYLSELVKNCVLIVLSSVFEEAVEYNLATDYSSTIEQRTSLFDNAIGYAVCVKMIELFVSSDRSNFRERNAKMAYNTLKIELEGAKNDNGFTVASGLIHYLNSSISKIKRVLFPYIIVVRDGSRYW